MRWIIFILLVIAERANSQTSPLFGDGYFNVKTNQFGVSSDNDTILLLRSSFRMKINGIIAPSSSYNILVHGLTDSVVYQVPVSAFATGSTIYTGNGALSGDRTVDGDGNDLLFDDMFTYRMNTNSFILDKSTPVSPYSHTVLGTDNRYQLGFTPTATVYSKGVAFVIDTNNNFSIGAQIPTTAPLYTSGLSAFVNGIQNQAGHFNIVESITSNVTANLSDYYFRIDATSGNVTITLPAASTAFGASMGIHYVFKRVDNSGNTVTIARAGSDLIDGATSISLTTQYEVKELQCSSTSTWDVR